MTTIRFGTDGWRAAIAEDYTFHNVRRCARGVADYLTEQGTADRGVVVAHDRRFASSISPGPASRSSPRTAFGA